MRISPFRTMALVGKKHPALSSPSYEVMPGEDLTNLVGRMTATLARQHGLALAAPQVGVSKRVIVFRGHPGVAVNPRILHLSEKMFTAAEGCLSLPGRWYLVPRSATVVVSFAGSDGVFREETFTGLDARCWQHEMDHLDGKLLVGRYPECAAPKA